MRKHPVTAVGAALVLAVSLTGLSQQTVEQAAKTKTITLPTPGTPKAVGYALTDPATGEIISLDGDQDAVADLNTAELKQERLLSAFHITHPSKWDDTSGKSADQVALEVVAAAAISHPRPYVPDPSEVTTETLEEAVLRTIESEISRQEGQQLLLTCDALLAPPNILWHNKITGANRVWLMNGTNHTASQPLPTDPAFAAWKMVGTGDFNGDGNTDIVWEHPTQDHHEVWYMCGTSRIGTNDLPQNGLQSADWRVVGVADFGNSSCPDLLWQYRYSDQTYVWFMDNTNCVSVCQLPGTGGDINWRIVGANRRPPPYNQPVILWRNENTSIGQHALWYMIGCNTDPNNGGLIHNSSGGWAATIDRDMRHPGFFDINGDGNFDMVLRHTTLGIHGVWFLNGTLFTAGSWILEREPNTNWRIATQEMQDSTWNLDRISSPAPSYGGIPIATVSGSQVTVNLLSPGLQNYEAWDVERRTDGANWQWRESTTGFPYNWTDTSAQAGHSYEYRVA